ncbi:hypothetical protein Tco_0389754 [Tanacetum coccineum]
MAESSSHNASSPEITPKEELVTPDKLESLNPFLPTTQVEFTFEEIAFTTNNETLEDSKVWVSTPTGGVRGDIGYNGEIGAKGTLKKSCLPPRWRLLMDNGVQVDYAKLIWENLIHKLNKKIREKIVPYPRFISLLLKYIIREYDNEELTINPTQVFSVHNWTLKPNQPEEPPFITHMKAICKLDVPVVSKAPKPSSQTEEVPKAKSLELKVDSEENNLQNTHLSPRLRHTNPKLANQKQKLSPVRPRTKAQAILHLPLYFFHLHSESASGHDALTDSTAEADPGSSAPNDSIYL